MLSQTSFFIVPKIPHKPSNPHANDNCRCIVDGSSLQKRKNTSIFCCQTSESVRGYSGLTPPWKTQEAITLKDIVVDGRTTAVLPLTESKNGIGILKFLQGKSYFITGATGFLGKVVIEKILRTVPDVFKIFILIKTENKEAAMDRLKIDFIDSELFDCLKQMHGKSYQAFMLSKLVPVVGNVCEYNLGMDVDSTYEIAEEVDVIINSAANTTFDERYYIALDTNTRGPCRLMNFAKKSYVNGERKGIIKEKPFYLGENLASERVASETPSVSHPMLEVDAEIKLALDLSLAFQHNEGAENMKELGLERAKINGWRNTYEFTKSMGEMLINSMRGEVPVVIIRPSIIESTYKDPFPGWIQGNRMLDPIILSYGKGQLPGFVLNPEVVIDVIPVDMVVNAIIAAIAKHGIAAKPDMNVYHVASSVVNPLLLHDLFKYSYEHFVSLPFMDSEGKRIGITGMNFFSSSDDFSSYIGAAIFQQSGLKDETISNHKLSRRLERKCKIIVEHAIHLAKIYEPYMFYEGWFDNSNTHRLMEEMSEKEMMSFGFDVGSMDWRDYLLNIHIPGLRKHVMKGRLNA